MMRKALGLVFVAIFASVMSAQTPSGVIKGTVIDPSGAAVLNAQVTATNQDTNHQIHVTTKKGGRFSFQNLPAGTYTVNVSVPALDGKADNVAVNQGKASILRIQVEAAAGANSVRSASSATPAAAPPWKRGQQPPQSRPPRLLQEGVLECRTPPLRSHPFRQAWPRACPFRA
jgi:hypothetical protein